MLHHQVNMVFFRAQSTFCQIAIKNPEPLTQVYGISTRHNTGTIGGEGNPKIKPVSPKMPSPQESRKTIGAAKREDITPSIVVAATINGNQCHKEICDFLIPRTTGWENLFLREMVNLTKIGAIQKAKILEIAERYEQEKESRRICRHCQGLAQIIDEYSYSCRNCGNCLNLQWGGEK